MNFYLTILLKREEEQKLEKPPKINVIKELNHGSQNVLGVLTWIGGY
jgi:hypothetical protein